MDTLLKKYDKIYSDLEALNKRLISLYQQVEINKAKLSDDIANAKQKLADDLAVNKRHIAKVNAFIEIARTHSSTHTNASSAKPFDSGILSRLSVQINSGLSNDPYAVQLYTEATAQLIYLRSAVDSLTRANDIHIANLSNEFNNLASDIESQISITKAEIENYLFSISFSSFIDLVLNDQNVFGVKTEKASMSMEQTGTISIGSVELPLPIPKGMETKFVDKTKGLCNAVKSTISIPANLIIDDGLVILAEYTNSSEADVLKGVQNILLNNLRHYGQDLTQIAFIDPIRFNSSSLGCLSQLCGDDSIIDTVPNSEEGIRKKLKSIVATVSKSENKGKKQAFVFHDFPQAYDSTSVNLIQQLCANAEYYGITVILTHNQSANRQVDSDIYQFIKNIATNITVESDNNFYLSIKNDKAHEFTWYSAPSNLPSDIEQVYINEKPVVNLDNLYLNRVGFEITLGSPKGKRWIDNIPYGVDSNGNILSHDFEGTNFATYICGAARSGKSTLIHTIITGILKSTHPDNVEIWLVDFGKTEFSRYANKDIPHIRYIMLDNSPEMVYDLVDRLTEIMHSRQNRFMGKWEKLTNVPEDKYMPELFIIIDEFSVMSNVLADSVQNNKEDYKRKLEEILRLAAKLGMRFIFSSQTFTNGIRGLTEPAKDQIQQRIALKADYHDVKGTLDLISISDRDALLMEQLPTQYALKKIPLTDQGDRLNKSHVLFIPNVDYQLPLFESLNRKFAPKKVYDHTDLESYIYKRPMTKDGNAFEIFDDQKELMLEQLRRNANGVDKVITMYLGSPLRMLQIFPVEIVDGFCENCLLIAPIREKMSGTSLVISAGSSLELQNVRTECWSSNKNPIYRQITNECDYSFNKSFVRVEDICARISQIKQAIENKIEANTTIFIMSYETIMMDLQYLAEETKSNNNANAKIMEHFSSKEREEGESDVRTILKAKFASLGGSNKNATIVKSNVTVRTPDGTTNIETTVKVYDARDDLKYILTHGPRLGYHFVMQFDSCGDFRQTKLDESLFRHRIMFQTAKSEAAGIVNSAFAESVSNLTSHIFRYTNGIEEVSFRPYLHNGVCIDGWSVQGQDAININDEEEDYLE